MTVDRNIPVSIVHLPTFQSTSPILTTSCSKRPIVIWPISALQIVSEHSNAVAAWAGEGMQLHDLGELLVVSRANITGLIYHFEQKGYVNRVVDQQDRRARFARITRKAEALLDEFMLLIIKTLRCCCRIIGRGESDPHPIACKSPFKHLGPCRECLRVENVSCPTLG